MRVMSAEEAARVVKTKMGNDPQPKGFTAIGMEGRHIPDGTFDDFVRETWVLLEGSRLTEPSGIESGVGSIDCLLPRFLPF